ncbi:hypothetical protein AMECASPLE_034217, partial [Ameca splendens]
GQVYLIKWPVSVYALFFTGSFCYHGPLSASAFPCLVPFLSFVSVYSCAKTIFLGQGRGGVRAGIFDPKTPFPPLLGLILAADSS